MSYNTKNKTFAVTQENEKRIKELAFTLGKNQNWVINTAIQRMFEYPLCLEPFEVFDDRNDSMRIFSPYFKEKDTTTQ